MKRILALVYGGLLVVSGIWKEWVPASIPARESQSSLLIPSPDVEQKSVEIRYLDTARSESDGRPVLVLLHGSPMASPFFDPIIPHLADEYRLIIPDFPGFGTSQRRVEDYSIESHASYLRSLLDRLELESYHLLGYSMGGGVALAYTRMETKEVDSIILLSSIGLQEYELLGDYTLNRALHAAQLFVFWSLEWFTPHFGYLDRALLNYRYARNFYDSDQRPLEEDLLGWNKPAFILHGDRDGLVPFQAALAHQVAMPQAAFKAFEGQGHLLAYRKPEEVAEEVSEFIAKVESGTAAIRQTQDRVEASSLPPMRRSHWFMGSLLGLATFASEDLACIGGGLLATRGVTPLWVAIAGCLVGIFVGDFAIYLMGRFLGRSALKLPILRRMLSQERVDRCARWLDEKGLPWIVSTRFVPGTRVPTYFVAGVVKASSIRFAFALGIGAAIWTPLLVGLSYWLGGAFLDFFERLEAWALLGLLVVSLSLLALARMAAGLATWRGRRLLYSRFRRIVRWEYWPMWAVYPPVIGYLLWQMLRRRSLTLLTAVNPCMPASGLVYESKSAILAHLSRFGAPVGRFELIPLDSDRETKREALRMFMDRNGLDYPVALKPDVGQRGQGVSIVKSESEAMAFFDEQSESTIAQEYLPGREYGVFYYRYPERKQGDILSITDKRLIEIEGDGKSNLERLILSNERAVEMAGFFLESHRGELHRVLENGETFALTELGTHCRGAMFLDGEDLLTDELRAAVDDMSRDVDGFHFGRYDIRVPSEKDLMAGLNIRIIELNGLTSESTNIYDPKHGLLFAYRTLMRQFRIAFDIAAQNRSRGVKPDRLRKILRLVVRYSRGLPSE